MRYRLLTAVSTAPLLQISGAHFVSNMIIARCAGRSYLNGSIHSIDLIDRVCCFAESTFLQVSIGYFAAHRA